MRDNNNRRAQNFDNAWSAKNIESTQLTRLDPSKHANEILLLDNIRNLLIASVHDNYGTTADKKYQYIVNLILARIKNALTDTGMTSNLSTIESEIDEIKTSIDKSGSDDIKKIFSTSEEKILKQFEKYVEKQKAEIDSLKSYISEYSRPTSAESKPKAEKEPQKGSKLTTAADIRKASDQKEDEDLEAEKTQPIESIDLDEVVQKVSDAVNQLEDTINIFVNTAVTQFAEIAETINANFNEMKSSLASINGSLTDLIQSTEKSFDDVMSKIEKSNSDIIKAISRIQLKSKGGVGAIASSLISGVSDVASSLIGSMSNIVNGVAQSVGNVIQGILPNLNLKELDKKIDNIGNLTASANEKLSIFIPKADSKFDLIIKKLDGNAAGNQKIPKDFGKKTSKRSRKGFFKAIRNALEDVMMNSKLPVVAAVAGFALKTMTALSKFKQKMLEIGSSIKSVVTSGFKKMTKAFKKGLSGVANVTKKAVSGAMSVVSFLLKPFKLLLGGLFKMVSVVFKPLKWILDLLTSPAILIALGVLFYLVIWPKIKDPLINWYKKHLEPAMIKIKEIFAGDQPFFDKVKASLAAVWESIWKPYGGFKGALKMLGGYALDFLKDTVWPFIKDNWKEILVSLGIFSFLANPLGTLSIALKGVMLTLNAIKLTAMIIKGVVIASKLVIASMPAVMAALPIVIPAAIAAGVVGYFIKDAIAAEKALNEQCQKGFADGKARGEAANKAINDNLKAIREIRDQNIELFKKLDISTTEDLVPTEIKTADGRVTTAEFLKDNVDKIGKLSSSGSFNDAMEKISKNEGWIDDKGKTGIYARGFSRVNAQFNALLNFANSFASDKLNHIGDETLLQRHKVFIDMLNRERSRVGIQLQDLNHEIDAFWSAGSDGEWTKRFDDVAEQVKNWGANAMQYLTTNPSKATGPVLNFSKVVDGKVVAMNAAEQAAELRRYNAELAKLSAKDKELAMKDVHRGRAISYSIDSNAFQAVHSGRMDEIKEMTENKELIYNNVIQDFRNRQEVDQAAKTEEMLKNMKFAINDTAEDHKTKDLIMKMVKDQALQNLQLSGGKDSTITDEQYAKIFAAARANIESMMANQKDMTPEQKKRYEAQLEAIKSNQELNKKIDELLEEKKKKDEEEKPEKTTTNIGSVNNTQVTYTGNPSATLDTTVGQA